MAMLQMDLPAANRFVSSLSKSLQALCHGCMDFDTEIEIVGYINVNIDCGSKVDYVLNEKVSKSTNNSMKFISNSFLAKQDEPKTDRSCSPIPELNVKPPARGSASSSYSSSQLYKSSGIFSPHSQVLRGSQKRAWSGGDWRASHRKMARGPRPQYDPSYNSQSQSNEYSAPNQSSSFPKPSTSQQEYTYSENSQSESQVHVKSEAVEETDNSYNQNIPSGDNSTQDSALVSDINIKSDPDSADASTNSNAVSNPSFLHPQSTDGAELDSKQSSAQDVPNSESFLKSEQMPVGGEESGVYNNELSNDGNGSQPFPETDVSFQTQEDQEFAGEESGDGSQFDVIEIDDEDEDLAAFTDQQFEVSQTARLSNSQLRNSSSHNNRSSISSSPFAALSYPAGTGYHSRSADGWGMQCSFCTSQFHFKTDYHKHLAASHRDEMPFHCSMCEKVFFSESGLKNHLQDHGERKFVCPICDVKSKRKHHLQIHLKVVHKLLPCPNCPLLAQTDKEFTQHILHCTRKKK